MKIAIDMDDCITNTQELDFACAWNYNKLHHPNDEKLSRIVAMSFCEPRS